MKAGAQFDSLLKPPKMFGFYDVSKYQDIKKLAAMVFKGQYNLEEEEKRLN